MTRQRQDDHSTEFGLWLRRLKPPLSSANYDAENLDYIWFNYRQGWFITIEEKRFDAKATKAQLDTHGIVSQMLMMSSGREVETMRGVRPIFYRGHYCIAFENTNPEDSAWIKINGEQSSQEELLETLKTGRRHARIKQVEDTALRKGR